MKLILLQYLSLLKERNEFDALLPKLLLAMGYVPISKPQTGVAQKGVDIAATGIAKNGEKELLLLVVKTGDVGRSDWDSGKNSIRPSLNQIIDSYLRTHIDPAHKLFKKRIIIVSTGELKQELKLDWTGYVDNHTKKIKNKFLYRLFPFLMKDGEIEFDFWNGDQIAAFIDQYMLDEHLFSSQNRDRLRKSLALAGDPDYSQKDLHDLFRDQFKLDNNGIPLDGEKCDLIKALRLVNLATQIFSKWSEDEGNLKQALLASEKAMLWAWHRIHFDALENDKLVYKEFAYLWMTYNLTARRYFDKIKNHLHMRDGLSGGFRESTEFSLAVFEQIGLISTIGLSELFFNYGDADLKEKSFNNAGVVADALANLIINNPISGSPRFDRHVVDITLGLLLLALTNKIDVGKKWVEELIVRVDYTFRAKRNFPISTDSIDDLIDESVFGDIDLRDRLMNASWLLPTLAGWAIIFQRDDLYELLVKNIKNAYPEVCLQLWHPTQDIFKYMYFQTACYLTGESEAPICLAENATEFCKRAKLFLKLGKYNIFESSTATLHGIPALNLIACRHFQMPIPASFWYQFLPFTAEDEDSNQTCNTNITAE